MFGFHKHKWVEYARSLMNGEFFTEGGIRYNGPHTIITYKCTVCGRLDQQTLISHIP